MILKQLLERLEYEVVQGSDKIEITTLIKEIFISAYIL